MHGPVGLKVHAAWLRRCRHPVNARFDRTDTVSVRAYRAHHRTKPHTRAERTRQDRHDSWKADRLLMRNPPDSPTFAPRARALPPRWSGHASRVAAIAGMVFIGLVLVLQWLRRDLWWVDAQLSAYLHGPYGLLLRTAYCLLAASMAWLARGLYAALAPAARSRTVLGLFWMAAVGLCMVSIGDSWMPELAPEAAAMVHVLSADTTFLCVIAAVLLQSWYFRRDVRWRAHFPSAFLLGWAAFAVLLFHVTVTSAPLGISQKIAIVLIVVWMVRAGTVLARCERDGAARLPHSRDNAGVNQP
ncbi:DUF998 domain-containing protein [Xanthomonas citri pv. malvacearum]|nr:DUF998 domain-containing protein [Xanthomonas citri]WAW94151.1 DUF998 domain-containing protein [Xanthomonas citri pv. malvacearum]